MGKRIAAHFRAIFMRPKDIPKLPGKGHIFEPKYDGVRTKMKYEDGELSFLNRRGVDTTDKYPEFSNIKLNADEAVIDGEVVAKTKEHPFGDFKVLSTRDRLQNPELIEQRSKTTPLLFVAFDINEKNHKDLNQTPLLARKEILQETVPKSDIIEPIEYSEDGNKMLAMMKKVHGEGIVAKKSDSTYHENAPYDWGKYKLLKENDVVVTGYTKGTGKRKGTFGALLMSVWDGSKYKHVGKVGTGFSDDKLRSLKSEMDKIKVKEEKGVVKLQPKIIARIRFLKKTDAGIYREPRFEDIRTDIFAKDTHL